MDEIKDLKFMKDVRKLNFSAELSEFINEVLGNESFIEKKQSGFKYSFNGAKWKEQEYG